MKKLKAIAILLIAVSYSAIGQTKEFTINGKAELDSGQMLIIAQKLEGPDTLGQSHIVKGQFNLKGTIDEAAEGFLTVIGYEGGFQFLLEPGGKYTADLKKTGKSSITGGKLQNEYLAYVKRVEQGNAELKDMQRQVDSTRNLGHFKTLQEMQGKLEQVREKAKDDLAVILKRNENNFLGAYIQTSRLKEVTDINHLNSVYDQLMPGAQSSVIGKMLAAKIKSLQKVDVASIAPDFTLQTPEGKDISLYSIRGKLKIIDFWASWCGPCRLENPNVVKLYSEFKDKGLAILSVSLDEKKDPWLKAIKMDGMPWFHASSLDGFEGKVVQAYHIDAVPTIFILDENNEIIAKNLRGEKLREFVENYLN